MNKGKIIGLLIILGLVLILAAYCVYKPLPPTVEDPAPIEQTIEETIPVEIETTQPEVTELPYSGGERRI